ncbi:DNA topoisomerase, partial [Staphylococcus aureus]|uniref:DNA topoisomerase n=1 Tax=Staphylococcus aureus TaxID=1280 RepID=UPI0037D9D14C
YTQPPPTYTHPTLLKTLQQFKIAPPSTYPPTIHTIQNPNYVKLQTNPFLPTHFPQILHQQLKQYFPHIIHLQFTVNIQTLLHNIPQHDITSTKLI